MLSASATSPDIANSGEYIFRTAINDLQLGIDIGNTMWVDGVRRVATITESTDYAEGARRTSVARLRSWAAKWWLRRRMPRIPSISAARSPS